MLDWEEKYDHCCYDLPRLYNIIALKHWLLKHWYSYLKTSVVGISSNQNIFWPYYNAVDINDNWKHFISLIQDLYEKKQKWQRKVRSNREKIKSLQDLSKVLLTWSDWAPETSITVCLQLSDPATKLAGKETAQIKEKVKGDHTQ